MAGSRNSSEIQSVARAIQVLKSFTLEKVEWGVNELSRELGLHKSTVSRLMTTLERGGLLFRNPESGRYRLGVDLLGLAAHVTSYLDVREIARPMLRELAMECQETVNLVVIEGGQVVNVEQFVPPIRQVMNFGWVGRRMPLYCTAAGKVLLAYIPPDRRRRYLRDELLPFTPHTLTDRDELDQEMKKVHKMGYAVVEEEYEEGLNAIAAPIFDHEGCVTSSVSIAGPAYRIPPGIFPVLAQNLLEVTRAISSSLGYRPTLSV